LILIDTNLKINLIKFKRKTSLKQSFYIMYLLITRKMKRPIQIVKIKILLNGGDNVFNLESKRIYKKLKELI